MFSTIEARATHLAGFIDGYARFAKLPQPRIAALDWAAFIARLRAVAPFELRGEPPREPAHADAAQLEQVVINLLKNAGESGSAAEEVALAIRAHRGGVLIEVTDRGAGLTEDALASALLPFFSTKESGTGLGLTICREIVEAHGGHLTIANREGGGALASVWLPAPEPHPARR